MNRFQRHSRATTSQVCSANSFMDFPIPQTLEDRRVRYRTRAETWQKLHAGKGHSPALTGDQGCLNCPSVARSVLKSKW